LRVVAWSSAGAGEYFAFGVPYHHILSCLYFAIRRYLVRNGRKWYTGCT
jgi:hypothetical protein